MELRAHFRSVAACVGFLLITALCGLTQPSPVSSFVGPPLQMIMATASYAGGLQAKAEEKPSTEQTPAASAGFGRQLAEASREAAGEGDENAQFKQSPSVKWVADLLHISVPAAYWVAYVINFIVIFIVLVWFWRSSVPAMFRNRTASIRKAMDEAQRASGEANQRLASIESHLSRLDAEIQAMHQQAEQDAITEEAKIREATEQEKQKIIAAAEQEIAAAAKLARRELTTYAAELAINLAQKQIRVDTDRDRQLVRTFAEELANGDATSGKDGHR